MLRGYPHAPYFFMGAVVPFCAAFAADCTCPVRAAGVACMLDSCWVPVVLVRLLCMPLAGVSSCAACMLLWGAAAGHLLDPIEHVAAAGAHSLVWVLWAAAALLPE